MIDPKVSEKDMLDVLSAIVGAADGEGAMDERDYEVVRAIRAAIEHQPKVSGKQETCNNCGIPLWLRNWYLLQKWPKPTPEQFLRLIEERARLSRKQIVQIVKGMPIYKTDHQVDYLCDRLREAGVEVDEPAPPAKGE
jgi:hypothetical protein